MHAAVRCATLRTSACVRSVDASSTSHTPNLRAYTYASIRCTACRLPKGPDSAVLRCDAMRCDAMRCDAMRRCGVQHARRTPRVSRTALQRAVACWTARPSRVQYVARCTLHSCTVALLRIGTVCSAAVVCFRSSAQVSAARTHRSRASHAQTSAGEPRRAAVCWGQLAPRRCTSARQ
jgi:hypothetical protein